MSGSERAVAMLVVLGVMVVVAEGWIVNLRDWVRATVGASNSTNADAGKGVGGLVASLTQGASAPAGTPVSGGHTAAYKTF